MTRTLGTAVALLTGTALIVALELRFADHLARAATGALTPRPGADPPWTPHP